MDNKKKQVPPADEYELRKKVAGAFEVLCAKTHGSADTVFDHLLEFIVNGWTFKGNGIKWWSYDRDQTAAFLDMYKVILSAYHDVFGSKSWYDFLGELYEAVVAGTGRRQGNGQFFTPIHMCDCMAGLVGSEKEDGKNGSVIDPCCGSGRLLLAYHAVKPQDVLHANDIDRTCCLMAVCNFLFHGCMAVVTCGNGLMPDDGKETWYVHGQPAPVPFIIKKEKEG